jgi:hypothetical protein
MNSELMFYSIPVLKLGELSPVLKFFFNQDTTDCQILL